MVGFKWLLNISFTMALFNLSYLMEYLLIKGNSAKESFLTQSDMKDGKKSAELRLPYSSLALRQNAFY